MNLRKDQYQTSYPPFVNSCLGVGGKCRRRTHNTHPHQTVWSFSGRWACSSIRNAAPPAQPKTTLNNGYLGSRNDEERSEMRYVMRIADLVNHQIFERILHFRVRTGVFLFECLFSLLAFVYAVCGLFFSFFFERKSCLKNKRPVFLGKISPKKHSIFVKGSDFSNQTSNQERGPPEFKHIIKGRKRN